MKTDRRNFLKMAGVAGAGLLTGGARTGRQVMMPPPESRPEGAEPTSLTELFLDNHLIEVTPGVSRRLHQAKKHPSNPVVRCDRWCDGNILDPYTTMYDPEEKLFKMWARTGADSRSAYLDGNAAYMTYLTSADGVHWDKPNLGLVEIGGRRDHNIVFTSGMISDARVLSPQGKKGYVVPSRPMEPQGKKAFFWAVTRHPHPNDASEKFIALAIVQDHRRGAHLVRSPDGIHWSCAAAPFWQTPHDVSGKGDDCLMEILYDKVKQKWVVYRRIIPQFSERMVADESDRERKIVDRFYRSYARAESDDLREWKDFRFILSMDPDDPPDTELYQFSCYQLGPIYVGTMSVYHLDAQSIDIQLATSRDGINFTRVCRGQPLIPSGPSGYYDYMAMGCSQPEPVIVGDTVFLYYAAYNFAHNADMAGAGPGVLKGEAALATLKRDRFASLETGDAEAGLSRVITKPFTVRHSRLYLNAATWEKGSIRVEVLTRDWLPIPGFTEPEAREIRGDALDHPVRWQDNADLGKLSGKEIRLKFYMARARLHAMTLCDEDRKLGAVEDEYRHDKNGDSSPKLI